MKNINFPTSHVVYCLGVPIKKIQNDMTRGLLPITSGPGTGRARTFTFDELVRIALYYQLVDNLGVVPRNASELSNKMVNDGMVFENTSTLYAIYKDSEGNFHAEISPGESIFENLSEGFHVPQKDGFFTYTSAISLLHINFIIDGLEARFKEIQIILNAAGGSGWVGDPGDPSPYLKRMLELNDRPSFD